MRLVCSGGEECSPNWFVYGMSSGSRQRGASVLDKTGDDGEDVTLYECESERLKW